MMVFIFGYVDFEVFIENLVGDERSRDYCREVWVRQVGR